MDGPEEDKKPQTFKPGEALRRALETRGVTISAGEAALLANRLLGLIQQGLIVPANLPGADTDTPSSARGSGSTPGAHSE